MYEISRREGSTSRSVAESQMELEKKASFKSRDMDGRLKVASQRSDEGNGSRMRRKCDMGNWRWQV